MEEKRRVKRFYKDVSIDSTGGRFAIALDGRMAKTPARSALSAPTQRLAEAVAQEWRSQGEHIEQRTMPLTGMLTAAIDGKASDAQGWRDQVLQYLQSDLVCYRADGPVSLVARQAECWDPYLDFMRKAFKADLVTTSGIVAVGQPEKSVSSVCDALNAQSAETLFALQILTAISGSAVIALGVWKGVFPMEQAFEASRLDEQFQEEKWGVDEEAKGREAGLRRDFMTAAKFLTLL